MRLLLTLSANRTPVEYNHLHVLAGALHKWLGPNEEHGELSLYTYSWLQGARADARGIVPNDVTTSVIEEPISSQNN